MRDRKFPAAAVHKHKRHQLFTTECMLSQEQHTIVNLRLLSLLPRGNMKLFHAKQRKIFSHGHNIQNIQLKCLIFSSVPLKRSPEPKINHQSPLQAVLKGRSHLLHPSGFKVTMRRPIS